MDINNQKLIYFYCPKGVSYKLINKNLKYLGLDKNKKIINTYPRDLSLEILENTYIEKYKDFDILCFYEFYDFVYNTPNCFQDGFKVIIKYVADGKQIVMTGHKKVNELKKYLPIEMIKQIVSYDLKYDLD